MLSQLRIPLLLVVGALLAGAIFYGFYSGEENIEAASTGFNASSKGFFGWDYSFAEHTFEPDGEVYRSVMIDSGREVRFGPLAAEIILCLVLGLGATFGTWVIVRALGEKPGEQCAPCKNDSRVGGS